MMARLIWSQTSHQQPTGTSSPDDCIGKQLRQIDDGHDENLDVAGDDDQDMQINENGSIASLQD